MPQPPQNSAPLHRGHPRPTFTITCWLLALIAFAQLITVGTALTIRERKNQPQTTATAPTPTTPQGPIQARSLKEILASVGDAPSTPPTLPSAGISPTPPQFPLTPQTNFPTIAHPRVERLVQEARSLQMDGDIMRSMLKLDEASRIDPAEPAVLYQKALIFEEMGLIIKAADLYQKIQQMGIKAGPYFNLAANKLTKGMDTAQARRSAISIGPMNTRKPPGSPVKHADVAITILARPDKPVTPADVHVQVHFYDKVNGGEIKKAATNSEITLSWIDTKTDWKDAGNEETIRISYTIPDADLADEHLLGRREFYGYVVELLYKGDIVDQQAHPRRLHSIHASMMGPVQGGTDPLPWLPDDDSSLLPHKNHPHQAPPALPPLPTR